MHISAYFHCIFFSYSTNTVYIFAYHDFVHILIACKLMQILPGMVTQGCSPALPACRSPARSSVQPPNTPSSSSPLCSSSISLAPATGPSCNICRIYTHM